MKLSKAKKEAKNEKVTAVEYTFTNTPLYADGKANKEKETKEAKETHTHQQNTTQSYFH
jgi:hypothetical protein